MLLTRPLRKKGNDARGVREYLAPFVEHLASALCQTRIVGSRRRREGLRNACRMKDNRLSRCKTVFGQTYLRRRRVIATMDSCPARSESMSLAAAKRPAWPCAMVASWSSPNLLHPRRRILRDRQQCFNIASFLPGFGRHGEGRFGLRAEVLQVTRCPFWRLTWSDLRQVCSGRRAVNEVDVASIDMAVRFKGICG